jgi:hypothetical protein
VTRPSGKVAAIAWLAADLGISPAAFYLMQAGGVGVVRALITATLVAGLWLAAGMIRTRRVDALAFIMMATYALMLAMAAATDDPKLVLLRDPVVSAVAGIVFLASCATTRPATAYLSQRLHAAQPLDGSAGSTADLAGHRVQSLVWGIALTAEATVRVALVFLLPISVVAGLSPTVELVLIGLLVPWMIWYRKRRRAAVPATV